MAQQLRFRVLVATDGSADGQAAVATALVFPWPDNARVRGVVASGVGVPVSRSSLVRDAVEDTFTRVAAATQRVLARRWSRADAVVADQTAVKGILSEARRFKASAIVLGWRGQGAVRRVLMGSVSRGVLRAADCPVLVVQHIPKQVRSLVVAFDGSANARRAAAFVGRLKPQPGVRLTLVQVVEPMVRPSAALPAGVRATLRREVAALNAEHLREARRSLQAAAAKLRTRGRRVRTQVRLGTPLEELLTAASAARADTLVVGARGVGGLKRLLLGSVADGLLNHSRAPVLVVR
jgi:nucleotide-binding universal stress UspA family protein